MRYLSLFSGIEAASAAWAQLGWECVGVAEIESFPCSVLAKHHPGVPNLGDITKITEEQIMMLGQVDLVVFGSPCQDLSVAGKRKGLDGKRSGLFFDAMRIVQWCRDWGDCRWALWENVPGAFSSNKGADFGVVVGQMAGLECPEIPPKGWGTEGAIVGTQAMVEWSVLDAQWFGVAQRRRRVFALADFGDWASRPPVLLEPQSMRGDSAPRRESGQGAAGTLEASAAHSRGAGTPEAMCVVACLDASYGRLQGCSGQDANYGHSPLIPTGVPACEPTIREQRPVLAFGGNRTGGPLEVAAALLCQPGFKGDFETETFILCDTVSQTLVSGSTNPASHGKKNGSDREALIVCATGVITHTLKADGFDASEDGTGRGTPIVAVLPFDTTQVTSPTNVSNPQWGDPCHPLAATTHVPSIAYSTKLHNTKAACAGKIYEEYTVALDRSSPPPALQVRRLTPRECERLQSFPDDHTLVMHRNKPAADGPRYKALGNSMCVNVMAWIGKQIDFVHKFY